MRWVPTGKLVWLLRLRQRRFQNQPGSCCLCLVCSACSPHAAGVKPGSGSCDTLLVRGAKRYVGLTGYWRTIVATQPDLPGAEMFTLLPQTITLNSLKAKSEPLRRGGSGWHFFPRR